MVALLGLLECPIDGMNHSYENLVIAKKWLLRNLLACQHVGARYVLSVMQHEHPCRETCLDLKKAWWVRTKWGIPIKLFCVDFGKVGPKVVKH